MFTASDRCAIGLGKIGFTACNSLSYTRSTGNIIFTTTDNSPIGDRMIAFSTANGRYICRRQVESTSGNSAIGTGCLVLLASTDRCLRCRSSIAGTTGYDSSMACGCILNTTTDERVNNQSRVVLTTGN